MTRCLRLLALLPIATSVALFVHAFVGTDHAVAGGHGFELGTIVAASIVGWSLRLGVAAFRGRRAGGTLRESLATALPGGGRSGAVAAVMLFESVAAFAGIEASEGRLLGALHLDPAIAGGLFAAGAVVASAFARLLAAASARVGAAIAERIVTTTLGIVRLRRKFTGPPRYERLGVRVHRGRAPPLRTISL